MSYPQLPYETVYETNAQLQKLCIFANENPELVDLIHQLLKYYACGYDPYDSNNKLNRLLTKFGNVSVADLCNQNPDMCRVFRLGMNEMCRLSKLSAKDFQKALCQYKLKTSCSPGNQNCNVAGSITDIQKKFCRECKTNKDYKPMFNTYFGFDYDKSYDAWFDYACENCDNSWVGKVG